MTSRKRRLALRKKRHFSEQRKRREIRRSRTFSTIWRFWREVEIPAAFGTPLESGPFRLQFLRGLTGQRVAPRTPRGAPKALSDALAAVEVWVRSLGAS